MPLERPDDAVAFDRIVNFGILGIDVLRQLALLEHARGRVFERRLHICLVEPKAGRDRLGEMLRVIRERPMRPGFQGDERFVAPDRFAVAPPVE